MVRYDWSSGDRNHTTETGDTMRQDTRQVLRGIPVFAGELPTFDVAGAPLRPEELFVSWLEHALAAGVREPHAMTVSTVGDDGMPSARVLILKNVGSDGWQFAAHAASPKGQDLTARPVAALTFYWPEQARQIRVRGRVVPATPEASAADFLARPLGSRAEASLGRQSQPLDDPAELASAVEQAAAVIAGKPEFVVPEWTLFTLTADSVEFWQGDEERRHTRLEYLAGPGGSWTTRTLWP